MNRVQPSAARRPCKLHRRRLFIDLLESQLALAALNQFPLSGLRRANGGDGSARFVLDGTGSSGFSVSNVGHVDGDGLEDLFIGAPAAGSLHGASYWVFGQSGGLAASME